MLSLHVLLLLASLATAKVPASCDHLSCAKDDGGVHEVAKSEDGSECVCRKVFADGPCKGMECPPDLKLLLQVNETTGECVCASPCLHQGCPEGFEVALDYKDRKCQCVATALKAEL